MDNTFEQNVAEIAKRLTKEEYIGCMQILSVVAKERYEKAAASSGTEQVKQAAVHDAVRSFQDELAKHQPGKSE